MRLVIAAIVAAAAIGLVACGDDDESTGHGSQATADAPAATTQTRTGDQPSFSGTTGAAGRARKRGADPADSKAGAPRAGKPATGGKKQLELGTSGPAGPPTAEQRSRDLPRGEPQAKSQLKSQDRQVYDVARFFCREAGVAVLRREYGIGSSDPEEIAREAARRTSNRGDVEAVYSGCLAGLRGSR